jgi:DeoR/GlpR family transcriptional regulator of sugar metabolism
VSNSSQPLFVEERRRIILEQLRQQGRVFVKDLSYMLKVSAVTIRQDLRSLEEDGLLERTYGGAVGRASSGMYPPELSFDARQREQIEAKEQIAAAAAAHVREGDAIALDASTTSYAMVPHLKTRSKLTVVTNSLVIAQSFLDTTSVQVLMPGGRVRRDSVSLVGKPDNLPAINLNLGFFGTRGISVSGGITESDTDEAAMKAAMVAHCMAAVIVADGSKWGQVAPYTFAQIDQIAAIITTADAPDALTATFAAGGVRIERV